MTRHDAGRMPFGDPSVTVTICNYNGRDVLPATLAALEAACDVSVPVILVDDGSTDGSVEWVRRRHPRVQVFSMGGNTRRVNAVRNRALRQVRTRYAMMIDNDVMLSADCLSRLLDVLRRGDRVFCCTPRLLYHDDPQRIYHDGLPLHYLCVSGVSRRGQSVWQAPAGPPRPTLGCGIMMVDMQVARALDFMDEEYQFGWGDDGEFQLRARILGYQVLHVSEASCLHVERSHGNARAGAQFYNRYRLMAIAYQTRTLVLLAPMLLLFELMMLVMAVTQGLGLAQWRAARQIARQRNTLWAKRRDLQRRRRVGDGCLLEGGPLGMTGARSKLVALGTAACSGASSAYWHLVGPWLSRQGSIELAERLGALTAADARPKNVAAATKHEGAVPQ